jgi:mRNA-degrading endonuclease HigB of HigAB toxin-antitoxin module
MIYFIRGKQSGNIKIGYSIHPSQRKANLQTAHYEDLEFVGIMDGSFEDESKLKERFVKFNIRGEWYRPVKEILDFIEQHKLPNKNIVTELGNEEYRIIFIEPVKLTMELFLLTGGHKIRVLADSDREFVFGVEGNKEILLSWLKRVR